jgi:hypothetical protein
MARLRELAGQCEGWPLAGRCARAAVVEVVDRFNAVRGRYCRECGGRRLKDLQQAEAEGSDTGTAESTKSS